MLLSSDHAGAALVAHANRPALAAGVRPGMSVGHARALIGDRPTHVEPHDPQRDHEALQALAQWALRFTPRVTVDPPAGLAMDVSGCRRLFGGYRRLVDGLADGLDRMALTHRIALASTVGGAWAIARFARRTPALVGRDRLLEALKPLPPAALRLDEDTLASLAEMGIDRIEHLLALPRAQLAERFGPELLTRLDQASGAAIETLDPIRSLAPPRVDFEFDGPAKQFEAVTVIARQLLDELCDRLAERESGAGQFELRLEHAEHRQQALALTLGRLTRDRRHLWSLMRQKLDNVDLGEGVDRMTLTARRVARLTHDQRRAWGGAAAAGDGDAAIDADMQQAFGELLDVLAGRLGQEGLRRPTVRESHLPWRAFDLAPAVGNATPRRSGIAGPGRSRASATSAASRPGKLRHAPHHAPHGLRHAVRHGERVASGDQPSIVFDRPEPIEVIATTPDGPPRRLRWRGSDHAISRALGPHRLTPEWWRGGRATAGTGTSGSGGGDGGASPPAASSMVAAVHRDYFKCQLDDGRWVWAYRAVTGDRPTRWFVHGVWA